LDHFVRPGAVGQIDLLKGFILGDGAFLHDRVLKMGSLLECLFRSSRRGLGRRFGRFVLGALALLTTVGRALSPQTCYFMSPSGRSVGNPFRIFVSTNKTCIVHEHPLLSVAVKRVLASEILERLLLESCL
jgi:hypothetical protein